MSYGRTDLQKIGKKIKAARRAAPNHLTQAYIAKSVGISDTYYAQIEQGKANPSLLIYLNIIDTIGVTSAEILGQ